MHILFIDDNFNPELLSDDLKKVYLAYVANVKKKSDFKSILGLKKKNLVTYLEKCLELAKSITYITFNKKREYFEVRPYMGSKRIYLGSTPDFDEACELLKLFLIEKTKENES